MATGIFYCTHDTAIRVRGSVLLVDKSFHRIFFVSLSVLSVLCNVVPEIFS